MTPADGRRVRTRPAVMVLSLAFLVGMGKLVAGCGNQHPSNLNEQSDGAPQTGQYCVHPYPGCSCGEKGQTAACGTVTLKSEDFIQCSMGTTTCSGTSWGPCDGTVTVSKSSFTGHGVRLVSPQTLTGTTCGAVDPCDPYCEVAAGEGGLTIVVAEGGTGDAGPTTTVSGIVYDPGVNAPLPNIEVYQPTGALVALTDGVSCDTCATLTSPYSSITSTDVNGHFILPVTPAAGSADIVMQAGRWRRQITVGGITSGVDNPQPTCTSGAAAACQTRLPQTAAEGNIPLIAISMGSLEPFECDFAKFMGGTSEMGPPSAGTRIQLYEDNGGNTSPAAPSVTTLYASQAAINAYTAVIFPCSSYTGLTDRGPGGPGSGITAADEAIFINYAEAGGGMFIDHDSAEPILQTAGCVNCQAAPPFNTVAAWNPAGDTVPNAPAQGKVLGADAVHTEFLTWLTNQGAYGGGFVSTPDPRWRATTPTPGITFEWLRGETNNNWAGDPGGNYSLSFSFDLNNTGTVTPGTTGIVAPGTGCGHVFFNDMHVDVSRAGGGPFPGRCNLGPPESPNEAAFEYLIFSLTSCIGTPPPPPPPTPKTFTSTLQAACPIGTHVQWGFFEWQGTIPLGTNVTFTAQTAPDNGAGPGTYGPAVFIGQATATTATWTTDACIVDGHLQDLAVDPNEYGLTPSCITGPAPGYATPAAGTAPQISQDWLTISMTLNPAGLMVPTLSQWQQLYDCAPDQ
jgi:hypothetical protein